MPNKPKTPPPPPTQRFGAHVSVAGGLHNAFTEGLRVGCDCIQIFVKNQRQWAAKPLTREQIELYRNAERQSGIGPVFAHASYLLNLAAADDNMRGKSVDALVDELERCEALGIVGLVVHPGAHLGEGESEGIGRIGRSLDQVHDRTRGFKCRVLLENTAGQGTLLGYTMEQLGAIIAATRAADRLGVCLDTCHLLAAGYNLRCADACAELMNKIDDSFGIDRVRCLHVNDSKCPLGSRVDRHEHVTKGKIGRAGFMNVLNEPRLAHVPRILETPKGIDERGRDLDVLNLRRLRGLVRI